MQNPYQINNQNNINVNTYLIYKEFIREIFSIIIDLNSDFGWDNIKYKILFKSNKN